MELQLKNIGMIKEANIKLDGLTVIAGENDTGKSTVGKALFMILHHLNHVLLIRHIKKEKGNTPLTIDILKKYDLLQQSKDISQLPRLVFANQITGAEIELKYDNSNLSFEIIEDNSIKATDSFVLDLDEKQNILVVETPLVWNFTDFFRDTAQVESQMRIELDYPYLMKDLNFKLHIKNASNGFDIKDKLTSLMGGEFKKDEMGRYYFDKQGQRIELVNTATGIKTFGIFQVLSQNNYLNKDTVLVLDEPEVHLHPKWQLKMAEIIVELVKNGVKVLVNSHSPYMIEALERYGKKEKINQDFYLAEDGYIKKENDSNSETLSKIFEKLSEPFDVFDEMDSEKLRNG